MTLQQHKCRVMTDNPHRALSQWYRKEIRETFSDDTFGRIRDLCQISNSMLRPRFPLFVVVARLSTGGSNCRKAKVNPRWIHLRSVVSSRRRWIPRVDQRRTSVLLRWSSTWKSQFGVIPTFLTTTSGFPSELGNLSSWVDDTRRSTSESALWIQRY